MLLFSKLANFAKISRMMKQTILLGILQLFLFTSLKAQTLDFAPYYPTLDGVDNYAAWHVVYPEALLFKNISGEAVCTVHIDSTGYLSDRQIVASHPLFAKAAAKVIDGMLYWQPAYRDGKRVESVVVICIPFNPDAYHERISSQQQIVYPCHGQVADVEPVFPDEVRKLVMGNMRWPVQEVQKAVAVCRFTVNTGGSIENVRILQGTHPDFDKEAIRILSSFPLLVPAQRDGKAVPFDYFLTMNFWKVDYQYYLRYREKAREDLKRKDFNAVVPASYPGGSVALNRFINGHLVVTSEMKKFGKQGRVIYSFEVDIDGRMKNFKLLRGLSPSQDAEALRVLKQVHRKWSVGSRFNTEKWYWEFQVEEFIVPVVFKW